MADLVREIFGEAARAPRTVFGLLALCCALVALTAEKADAMSDIQCEIRSKEFADGLKVMGVAWSGRPVEGDYNFVVNKEGRDGSTYIVQRSAFQLEPGTVQILGTASINIGEGDRYIVRLTVSVDGEETTCSQVVT